MMRLFRWNYLVPRLVLLFILLCLSEIGVGWGAKWALESQGTAAIGARVEVAGSRASLIKTRVTLTGIQVTNPDTPMTNLVEADQIDLDFDTTAALRRKMVINHGVLRGLRLGGERETSGAVEHEFCEHSHHGEEAGAPSLVGAAATEAAKQWLTSVESRLADDAVQGLRSPALADQLNEEWPRRAEDMKVAAATLQGRIEALQTLIEQTQKNPLRGIEVLRKAPSEIADLRARVTELRAQLESLPAQAKTDRERIADARRHDEQLIRERISLDNLDAESMTSYLLGEQAAGPVGKLIDTVRWVRSMLPAKEAETPAAARGVNVLFAGTRRTPDLLIRQLDLTGSARLQDRPVELSGVLTGFTTQPKLHGEPMKMRLDATGGLPFEIDVTLDRTGDLARDQVVVDCRMLPLPAARLGNAEWLKIESLASMAAFTANVTLDGEALEGELKLTQDKPSLQSSTSDANASSLQQSIAGSLNAGLKRASRVETTIGLAGTLDSPSYSLNSTLGPIVANAMKDAVRGSVEAETERLLADSRRKLDTQLAKLDETIAAVTGDLSKQVSEQAGFLDKLAKLASPSPFGGKGILGLGSRPAAPTR